MGGEGSMQGMITSLSNNRKLLRSKRLFKKERTFLSVKKEYLKAAKGNISFQTASKEEILTVRKKVLNQRRKERNTLIVISTIIVSFFLYFTLILISQNDTVLPTYKYKEIKQQKKKFLLHIKDADRLFKNKDWDNSIFYYNKAKTMYPTNYDINYRLVRAYGYSCIYQSKNCYDAKNLLNELFVQFPNKQNELTKIKSLLEYEY